MKIERDALVRLVNAIAATAEVELDCDEWLARVGALLEVKLRGEAVPENLLPVMQHIEVCATCAEEFRALLESLSDQP
jgi:hypothetical protein